MSLIEPDIDYDLDEELARGRADGSLIRAKARMALEHFGLPAMIGELRKINAPFSVILEANKYLMRLADMEPKPNVAGGPGGSALHVTINVPAGGSAPGDFSLNTIEPAPPTMTLSFDDLPPIPEGFKMPGFALTRDLMGPPLPKELSHG